jgi:hypothetical protein
MLCCGQRRGQIVRKTDSPGSRVGIADQGTAFQYTENSALTAIGPISRRQYRFGRPGTIVSVDSRDAASLAMVPNLRLI